MVHAPGIAEVGALIGDHSRARMMAALLSRGALTATELADVAGITPQTASAHLSRLAAAGLVEIERSGRHHHHRLASSGIARLIRAMDQLGRQATPDTVAAGSLRLNPAAWRARSCYDHVAGSLGVEIANALTSSRSREALSPSGKAILKAWDVRVDQLASRTSRPLCRACTEWSGRQTHLAGLVGKAVLYHALSSGWLTRSLSSRVLLVTPAGEKGFWTQLGIVCGADTE